MSDRELGKITSAFLGIEDHGIMTFNLGFSFGGTSQGFGGYALDDKPEKREPGHERRGTAAGMDLVMKILRACGVDSWEELMGRTMWVERERGMIVAIEAPKFERGGRLDIRDWQAEWFEGGA